MVANTSWPLSTHTRLAGPITNVSIRGVDIESEEPESGDLATRGKTVIVRLRGTLHRGDVFMDTQLGSTRKRNKQKRKVNGGGFSWPLFLVGLGLNVVYFTACVWFYVRMMARGRVNGQLVRMTG